MAEYHVKLEAVFAADDMADAVEQFCEWVDSGRRTVTIRNVYDSGEQGWQEIEMGY